MAVQPCGRSSFTALSAAPGVSFTTVTRISRASRPHAVLAQPLHARLPPAARAALAQVPPAAQESSRTDAAGMIAISGDTSRKTPARRADPSASRR